MIAMREYRITIAGLPHVLQIADEDLAHYPGAVPVDEEPTPEAETKPKAERSGKARKGHK